MKQLVALTVLSIACYLFAGKLGEYRTLQSTERCLLSQRDRMIREARREQRQRERRAFERKRLDLQAEIIDLATIK